MAELVDVGLLHVSEPRPGWVCVRMRDPHTGELGAIAGEGPRAAVLQRVERELAG